MTVLLALAAAAEDGQVAQIARTFGVSWPQFGAQVVSFAIVCALLYRFAYRPVLAMLAARREQIALGLANAEQIKAELARTEAQRQAVLAEANAQATRLIEEARAVMGRLQREEARKAVATAEQIVANAREAAARDHARMLAELKGEVGRLVVRTTAAVTGKVLTPEDQRRLAEETVRRLAG
jgi:F-type H+-transporting ATPase subunit b